MRFLNGTTVTGAGMPPALWVKQPVQEIKEKKGSINNLKGLRQLAGSLGSWPPPISPDIPGNPGRPREGLRQFPPPIHLDLPGNTEGHGKGGLRILDRIRKGLSPDNPFTRLHSTTKEKNSGIINKKLTELCKICYYGSRIPQPKLFGTKIMSPCLFLALSKIDFSFHR